MNLYLSGMGFSSNKKRFFLKLSPNVFIALLGCLIFYNHLQYRRLTKENIEFKQEIKSLSDKIEAISQLWAEFASLKETFSNTPSLKPALGVISSSYGIRKDPFTGKRRRHNGIDIAAPRGSKVRAAAFGKVISAHRTLGLGNTVILEHPNGFRTKYGHLEKILVKKGDIVKKGDDLGTVGSTGKRCKGVHLHYEVINDKGQPLDPINFISKVADRSI